MDSPLFSVRMRASYHGQHRAGAERIVAEASVGEVTAALTTRGMNCSGGSVDEVHCSVDRIDRARIHYGQLPDVSTYQVNDWQEGRLAACCLLAKAGVDQVLADQAVQLLANGAGPRGVVMRGAVIMDVRTGDRLEVDPSRGVRVSRMDLSPECRPALQHELESNGLGHHRVLEALLLAGKVLCAPGIVAELCWSDAPEYTTGYVASPRAGYQRISEMKPVGDARGGRIFFIDRSKASIEALVDYLQRQVVLFKTPGQIFPPEKWMSADE